MAYTARTFRIRWPAMVAAIVTTGLVGAAIISGLSVGTVARSVVQSLKTFTVVPPKPPPPPPQRRAPRRMKKPAGAPAKEAIPSPVVAPKPVVPLPAKQPAPTVPGVGASLSAGAGAAGAGTGAGGYGNGTGAGGAGFTPARKITKIPDSQYRRFRAVGAPSGVAGVSIRVNPDGTPSDCRIVRSSGNAAADALMCQLTLAYVRFSPARDPSGRPIAQQVTFFPNWSPR